MPIINMHEAKTNLSRLVRRAQKGEEIILGRAGEPLVRLVTYVPHALIRRPGSLKGKIWMASDFDLSSADITSLFYGDLDAPHST